VLPKLVLMVGVLPLTFIAWFDILREGA